MTSSNAKHVPEWPSSKHVPAEELARRKGLRPIESVDELARPGLFESDEFPADVYASRRAGMA